jgi:hypothetical protein
MQGEGEREELVASGVEMFMCVAPSTGIDAATESGTGRDRRLRPGRAVCEILSLDDATGDWVYRETAEVADDYPGFAVAPGAWCQVLMDRRGRYRLIGEEVGKGLSEGT